MLKLYIYSAYINNIVDFKANYVSGIKRSFHNAESVDLAKGHNAKCLCT